MDPDSTTLITAYSNPNHLPVYNNYNFESIYALSPDNMSHPASADGARPSIPLDDDRVSYSKIDGKYILENDDGTEWEWHGEMGWMPAVDEAQIAQQQSAYGPVIDVDDSADVQPGKKRKATPTNDDSQDYPGVKKAKKPKPGADSTAKRRNTAVYVTSLPLDVTVAEVKSVFSRCGVIAEEIDSGKPRIKLYEDENGVFKGDALVVFFRQESVSLAETLLDDTDFRLGVAGPNGKMTVKEAEFSYKKVKTASDVAHTSTNKDKKKIIRKTQKLNNKLADWDDDDPSAIKETASKWDKVVVLKHMFTLAELEADPALLLELKEEVRDEAETLGPVTNVIMYDKEPEGVMTVRFTDTKDADACVKLMDGRWFAQRQVEAYIADGHERFKKTNEKATVAAEEDEDDDAAQEAKRLEEWGKHLEGGGEDDEEAEQKHQEEFKKWSEQQKARKLGVGS